MFRRPCLALLAVSAAILVYLTPAALAQSSIEGQVRDTSGAVVAGAKVEAASPALIEGSRSATTDSEGHYTFVDLRPGTYTMTFAMDGFSTIRRSVDLPSNVTVPVDAEMQPGAVGQTIDVQAVVATVDVENVAHPSVLSRTDMDALPTARNAQSMGSYVPGVHLNTPDVAGSQQTEQTYMAAHGNPSGRDIYMLDGMLINVTQNDGQIQFYVDNAYVQEMTYQSNSMTADVAGGGVFTNMVPKDGGNEFHGNLFIGFVGSSFVGNNIDSALTARGVTGQSAVNKLEDFDGGVGGRIIRDKLWFWVSGRKQFSGIQSAGSFNLDGSPGIEESYIWNGTIRATWQVSQGNKFAVSWMRNWKTKIQDVVTGAGGYSDINPAISSLERMPKMYYILQGRWTWTASPTLLFQFGGGLVKNDYNINYHTGVQKTPFTPDWYVNATELDVTKLTRSIAGSVNTFSKYDRFVYTGSGVWVHGPHQIKFGAQDSAGVSFVTNTANGDAYYNYSNGVPLNITAYNTPTYSLPRLNADLGVYGMDTYRFKRLTVTAGVRWEYLAGNIDDETAPAGRFVPARHFSRVDCSTVKGLGCWKNWSPRLGGVYDLFGNHKTAVKASVGKYNTPYTTGFLNNFNPMFTASQTIPWVNAPTTACQSSVPGAGCIPSGSGFGDGNIGANPNPSFGQINQINLDPNYHREYQWQYHVGVQQELFRRITINAGWNKTSDYQQTLVLNSAVPFSAYTPQQIVNPLDGSQITVYNLQPAYFGLAPNLHQTNAPQSLRSNTYNGFEVSGSGRLQHGAFFQGSWTMDKQVDKSCDMNANPSGSAYNDPNSLRFCDWSGGLYQNLGAISGVPFRHEFKLQGSVPIKWGVEVSGSFYSQPVYSTNFSVTGGGTGAPLAVFDGGISGFKMVNWSITPSTKYPLDCNCPNPGAVVDPNLKQGSEVIELIAPGSRLTPRQNQIDLAVRKTFHIREKYRVAGELQIFNIVNSNAALTESYTLGATVKPYLSSGPGGQPSVIQNPRMLRLSAQFHF
jgi:hypothetical protein